MNSRVGHMQQTFRGIHSTNPAQVANIPDFVLDTPRKPKRASQALKARRDE
jgi:hypothetical protein